MFDRFFKIPLILILGLISHQLSGQPYGKLLVTNYGQYDIGSSSGVFWSIIKDHRGIVYFGGDGEIFEYDGSSWRGIAISNHSIVRSLAIDSNGIIYVGGVGEFGYLKPDRRGSMEYTSLLPLVPRNKLLFPDIWSINVIGHDIYFQSDNRLFRYDGEKIKTWELHKSYHRSFAVNNQLYLSQREIGLCTLLNDSVVLVPSGSLFKDMIISSITLFDKNHMLVGTRNDGLYKYQFDGADISKPVYFNCEASDFLKKNFLYCGINLHDGRFAFATLYGGVIIIDSWGKIEKCIDKATGSFDHTAYNIKLFNDNELWITTSKGIGLYNINSALSYWNDELGLYGGLVDIIEYQNKIFVASMSGLYYLDLTEESVDKWRFYPSSFKLYNDLRTEVWGFIKFDPSGKYDKRSDIQLLAGAGVGLYNINEKKIVFPNNANGQITIAHSKKNPSLLYFNTHPTFYILQYYEGKWHIVWQKNISSYIISITEDFNGDVWIGTMFYGVFRIHLREYFQDFDQGYQQAVNPGEMKNLKVTNYNTLNGLPNLNFCITHNYHDNLIISCNGLFSFDEKTNRFVRSDLFGDDIKSWDKTITSFKEDIYGNIWGYESEVFDKQTDGSFKICRLPYRMISLKNSTQNFFHNEDGVTWIVGEHALYRYDSKSTVPHKDFNFQTIIRKVTIDHDSSIFCGTNFVERQGEIYSALDQPDILVPRLPASNKTISFDFSCPYFQDDIPLEYSYYLEGYESDWSDWSYNSKKEYNNLRENDYMFHVRARNYNGDISKEGTYKFIIMPPWYRTILAYIIYGLAFILTIYLSIKVYSKRLQRYNALLEKTVMERTVMLEKQKEEINQQAQTLKEQNKKLIHQKNRMAEMSKEIMETNKSKLQFFTNISHELRTPLTLILGPVEELLNKKNGYSNTEKQNLYTIIHRNASRLLALINQILDFRKIEIQSQKLRASEGNIVKYVENIAIYFKDLAAKRKIEFVFSSIPKTIQTWFDHDNLEKVLFNLLSNAFKYTPDNGKISINVRLTEEHPLENCYEKAIMISIIDTGIGIADEVIPKIFDRYYQSSHSVSLNQAGSGIGLSMAARLIDIHHGKIELDSSINRGSTFSVYIPYGKDYLKENEKIKAEEKINKSDFIKSRMAEFKYLNNNKELTKNIANIDTDKDLILIVEDSEDIRQFIINSLKSEFTFIEAADGVEGLKLAIEYHPKLIITDIMMPNMDGYEFCDKIKSNNTLSHIPIIMLTSKSGVTARNQGFEKGVDDFISKPFNINLLKTRINNLLKSRAELRGKFRRELVIKPTDVVIDSSDEKFLNKAIKIVEENISNSGYDIEAFSKDMAMSQSTLYRRLKSLTGESTNNFIKEMRLKRAASLLVQNEISVSEIANMVGFDDPAYFSKSFKQKFGKSPSEYSKSKH